MRTWAIAAVLVLATTPVSADHVGIYDDTLGGPCFGPPPGPGAPFTMYILHEQATGSTGGRWNVASIAPNLIVLGSQCAGGVSIPVIPTDGMLASYGGCLAGTIQACQVMYLSLGGGFDGCNHLTVTPFAGDAQVQVLDCADQFHGATAGHFSFNISGQCDTCVLATEETTWGSVKALYR